MKRKMMYLMLTLFILSAASVKSQVIIGGSETQNPHAGAILDLSPMGYQKSGLLLPNVELGDDAADFILIAGATEEQMTAACGMLVYNTKKDVLNGAGLYVWTGTEWKAVVLAGN